MLGFAAFLHTTTYYGSNTSKFFALKPHSVIRKGGRVAMI